MERQERFEYLMIRLRGTGKWTTRAGRDLSPDLEASLNLLGAEGWELVSTNYLNVAVLQRRGRPETAP